MHDSWFTMMPHADDNVNDDGADVYDINDADADADAELYFEMGRIVTIRSDRRAFAFFTSAFAPSAMISNISVILVQAN